MIANIFVDTNIFVYAVDIAEPEKNSIAVQRLHRLSQESRLTLSTQILQEFFHAITRRLSKPLQHEQAIDAAQKLTVHRVVPVSQRIVFDAMARVRSASLSLWDALVVETALASGCSILLTEDLQHGQVFEGRLTVENPFLAS